MSFRAILRDTLQHPGSLPRRLAWKYLRRGPERVLTRAGAHGTLSFSSRDNAIGKRLFLTGEFGLAEIERACAALDAAGATRPGLLLDIGANIGTVCLPLVKRGRFSRALAFEPEPRNHGLLSRNITQNGLSAHIDALQLALSSRPGTARLVRSGDNFGDHRLRLGDAQGDTVEVPIATLDSVLADRKLSASDIALLWMDTQGHELEILRGASTLVHSNVPIVTELWPHGLRGAGTDPAEFIASLARARPTFYDLRDPSPRARPTTELAEALEHLVGEGAHTDLLLVASNQ